LPLGKLHIWEVATWENILVKLPLGKNPVGKYLTSSRLPYFRSGNKNTGFFTFKRGEGEAFE